MKYVPPSVKETAFNCSHCEALARQFWLSVHADSMKKDELPLVIDAKKLEELDLSHIEEKEKRERLKKWAERKAKGRPFFDDTPGYMEVEVNNVWLSRCKGAGD